jgi:hypothetical protein
MKKPRSPMAARLFLWVQRRRFWDAGRRFLGAGTGAKALCKRALRKKGPVQQPQFCAALCTA